MTTVISSLLIIFFASIGYCVGRNQGTNVIMELQEDISFLEEELQLKDIEILKLEQRPENMEKH